MILRRSRKRYTKNKGLEERGICNPNEINTLVEIPLYAPNQGLSPKGYQVSVQLSELEATFEDQCLNFLSKSNPDAFNSSYMDAVIERVCVDAIKFLKIQRCDHIQTIKKPLSNMHRGDYAKCRSKLENFKRDKERNEKELEKYRRIYYRGTSLAEEE